MENIKNTWVKKNPEDILKDSITIDIDIAVKEILEWLIGNVENFIDNSQKIFRLNMVLDNNEMPELRKLQDLYRSIPDENDDSKIIEECVKCREELNKITKNIHERIRDSKELLQELFKRMIFYYEKIIVNPDNKKEAFKIDEELKTLINKKEMSTEEDKENIQKQIDETIKKGVSLIKYEELEGSVDITSFDYEAFDVGVKVAFKNDNELNGADYIIPEGFACYLEISFYNNMKQTSMF